MGLSAAPPDLLLSQAFGPNSWGASRWPRTPRGPQLCILPILLSPLSPSSLSKLGSGRRRKVRSGTEGS